MRSSKKFFAPLVTLALAVLLSACNSVEEKRDETFHYTLSLFEHTLRWEPPEKQLEFFTTPETANLPSAHGMRVIDIQELTPPLSSGEETISTKVKLYYLNESSQSITTIDDTQEWRWMGEETGWRRTNPMPQIR